MDSNTVPIVHIRPRRSGWDVDWWGLLHYRDLLLLFVWRDFVSKYKQTVLGPLWMIIQPVVTTLIFTVVFNQVAGLSTDGAPPVLFYMAGLTGWNLFSSVFGNTSNTLLGNAGIFGKVYFPRLIAPLASAISQLIPFAIQMGTFLVFYLCYWLGTHGGPALAPTWRILALPSFIMQAILLGTGLGMAFSALTAVYRDLQQLSGFLLTAWMYLTPIIYPVSRFPARWRWVVQLNPMYSVVEGIKWCFLGGNSLNSISIIGGWGTALLAAILGFYYFNRTERSFVDRA